MIFLAKNLRYLREIKGLTQGRLAAMIGVKPNTVSNYENGNSSPDYALLGRIVEILDTDAHNFLYSDMRAASIGRVRRVSDVPMKYDTGRPDDKEDVLRETLKGYDRRLDQMEQSLQDLKEIIFRLLEEERR